MTWPSRLLPPSLPCGPCTHSVFLPDRLTPLLPSRYPTSATWASCWRGFLYLETFPPQCLCLSKFYSSFGDCPGGSCLYDSCISSLLVNKAVLAHTLQAHTEGLGFIKPSLAAFAIFCSGFNISICVYISYLGCSVILQGWSPQWNCLCPLLSA